ncbi:M28 family peptidase [Treponema sp. OMZ 857]|uniref:M28 family peptidase n=1 Tax=Treponema sp. OMZ 857 TaxID=1643513 RepID=UPI0020A5AF08|nr:M28 family peptidase [Treponema sp. OMZ 857]UTC42751.1 M28 family peptidase [Treponema sp. OMZ 857]
MTLEQAQAIIASPLFSAFLEPAADRCAFITARLAAQGIPYRTVTLQDKTHIVITYRQSAYNPRFKMKTLIAHYDRAAGTQGANDNSAACIQLLLFAQTLLQKRTAHNIRIIFTDGEEAGTDGIKNQGAYRLGQGLRALSMQQDDIFVFDMCGSGDTLILSESGIYGRDTRKTAALSALHRRCRIYADAACRGRWFSLPTAYSDNAGLISAGLTAQVITVLPREEAELLMRYMPRSEALQRCIITNAHVPPDSPLAAVIPQTWQRMHTPQDRLETLTPQAFILVDKMLRYLAGVKEPAG